MKQLNKKYHQEIASLKQQIAQITSKNKLIEDANENLTHILDTMKKIVLQDVASVELYSEVIEKIVLHSNHAIDIHFRFIKEPICLEFTTAGRGQLYRVDCSLRNVG